MAPRGKREMLVRKRAREKERDRGKYLTGTQEE